MRLAHNDCSSLTRSFQSVVMDGFDIFRKFLGIPRDGQGFKSPIWEEDGYDEDDDELDFFEFGSNNSGHNRNPGFAFRIFTGDFFEMHRDFERQFESAMRNIMGIMGSESRGIPELPEGPFHGPAQPSPEYLEPSDDHPRNRYLKPSFERSKLQNSRQDSDLDGRISVQEIDEVFEQPPQQIEPPQSPRLHFSGQTSFSKTVRGPNGRIEHHKTFRSSEGDEQTTVTRQYGNQSHSVIVRKNKDGTTEQTEDFVNMDEGDLKNFNRLWGGQQERDSSLSVPAVAPPPTNSSQHWVDSFLKIFK